MLNKIFKTMAIAAMLAPAALVGCDEDAEQLYIEGLESSKLTSYSADEIVLTSDNSSRKVLILQWDESTLSLAGDESLGLPDGLGTYELQFSDTESFAKVSTTPGGDKGVIGLTGSELNAITDALSMEAGVSHKLYVRVMSALSSNTEPVYSNVLTVNVTPYAIDFSFALILDADKNDLGVRLYSPEADGNYYGFVGASSWMNWYLLENNGTTWGNENSNWTAFQVMKNGGNFWYPEPNGCYYTTVEPTKEEWTATLIASLTVSGDVSGEMTYNRSENKWIFSFATTADNQSFKIGGTGSLYKISTGTDSPIETAVSFGAGSSEGELVYGSEAPFTVAQAGEYTLTLDLNDFRALEYEISAGATVIEAPLPSYLHVMGVNDEWVFDKYTLPLVSEDDSTYAGCVVVSASEYGYYFCTETDNWTDKWGLGEGDAASGTLAWQSGSNIPFEGTAGLYYVTVCVKSGAESYTATRYSEISYTGFNDNWDLTPMSELATGVFGASVSITKASEWGGQIVLGDWTVKFGGSEGKLVDANSSNLKDDASIPTGDYDLIVDFNKNVYWLVGENLYEAGLNDTYGFDVPLARTSMGKYSGTVSIEKTSEWGFYLLMYKDSWDYTIGGEVGSLVWGGDNISDADIAVGTYTMSVDLTAGTLTLE